MCEFCVESGKKRGRGQSVRGETGREIIVLQRQALIQPVCLEKSHTAREAGGDEMEG